MFQSVPVSFFRKHMLWLGLLHCSIVFIIMCVYIIEGEGKGNIRFPRGIEVAENRLTAEHWNMCASVPVF